MKRIMPFIFFDSGIIRGSSRHPKSNFRYRTIKHLLNVTKKVDTKTDVLIHKSISLFEKPKKLKNTWKNIAKPGKARKNTEGRGKPCDAMRSCGAEASYQGSRIKDQASGILDLVLA